MKGSISPKNVNEIVLEKALTYVKTTPGPFRILEIGSGRGAFIETLSTKLSEMGVTFEVHAADIEPDQVNLRNIGVHCHYLDAQKNFALDGKYNIVIAIELIEHIENPFHFIREIAKIISDKGLLLLTSPNVISLRSRARYFLTGCTDYFRRPYNEHWLNMGHVNPINPLQLIYTLRKNGFDIEKTTSNATTFESILLSPFVILIALFSYVHYILTQVSEFNEADKLI